MAWTADIAPFLSHIGITPWNAQRSASERFSPVGVQVRFDEPEHLVDTARHFGEKIRGIGIACSGRTLLPRMAVPIEAARADLHVRPFRAPVPQRTVALVWRRRSPLGTSLRALAATIRNVCFGDDSRPRPRRRPRPPIRRKPGSGRTRHHRE